jgi:hypothetical protein
VQEGKIGLFWGGGYHWEVSGHKESGMRVNMVMYFVTIYENRRMKPVEIVLRRRKEERRMMKWVNLIKIYYKHVCNYMLIKINKNKNIK